MEFDKSQFKLEGNRIELYVQMREPSDMCDVIIQVGKWKKDFHWCVLVMSPFFETIRKKSFLEKKTGIIKLNVATTLSTETAIKFLYGIKPKLTDDNISEILDLSEFLMIPNLKSACVRYIKTMQISIDNCMRLLELSSLYEFDLTECYEYIRGNLNDLLQREDAVFLTKESVIELFMDPHLSYVSSEVRFTFLVKWSKRWGENGTTFKEIFDCIDMDTMDKAFLEEALQHPLVPRDCKPTSVEVTSKEHMLLLFSNSIQNNRIPCFDLEKEIWYGMETSLPKYHEDGSRYSIGQINAVRNLKSLVISSVSNWGSSCKVSIHNLESKQTTFIKVSAAEHKGGYSCFCTDGAIFGGVTNKKTKIEYTVKANANASAFVKYRPRCVRERLTYSTFFYGHLDGPKTTINPVVTIRRTCISSCCINAVHFAGLLSEKEKTLYIYDIDNCKLETVDLKPHIYYNGRNNFNLAPSEKGFILYSEKKVVIVSRLHDPNLADKYAVQKVDLKHDMHWKEIQYFYCDAGKSWFRLLKKTDEDELEFATVSHDHLLGTHYQELVWKPLPLAKNLETLSFAEHVFMVRIHRSRLLCHFNCPHCKALNVARNPRTAWSFSTDQDDDYVGDFIYSDEHYGFIEY